MINGLEGGRSDNGRMMDLARFESQSPRLDGALKALARGVPYTLVIVVIGDQSGTMEPSTTGQLLDFAVGLPPMTRRMTRK